MDQESAPQTGQQKVINVITIVCLIVFPPIGLILMWPLTNWNKGIKVIVTITIILIAILLIGIWVWHIITLQSLYKELKELDSEVKKTTISEMEKEEKANVEIDIILPIGGERWREGETQSVIWKSRGLAGKKVKICLLGSNGSYQPVLAKENYQGECLDIKSYQIGEAFTESGKYDWEIPVNLSDKFWSAPAFYRVKIMPLEKIIEPGVSFKYGFSDYFEILERE